MVVPHKIVMGNLNRMMMRNRVIIYHQLVTKFMEKKKDEDNEEQPSNDPSNNKHPHEYKDYRSPGSYLPYGNEFYKQRQSFIKTGNIKKPHSEKTHIHDGVTKDKRHTGLQVYY